MTTFHIITAATYWLLIVMWTFILVFYIVRVRRPRLKNALFTTLIIILAIDAFRTLFESIYFGVWYTALAGLLPTSIQEFLEEPGAVMVPKLFNVVVAALIILILLRRWIPEEEKELQDQQHRELKLQNEVALRTSALENANERLRQKIVEHTLAQEALLKSEERVARTEEFSLVMTTHVGLDGRWLKVPPTLCQLLGYDEKDLLSQSFKAVTHPDDFEEHWQQCQRLVRGELQSFELEKRYVHRDGHMVWVYLNCSVVKDEEGQPLHFLTYIRDITDRKQIEQEREQLSEELIHAQKMEAIGRLAGGVAHEFNNRLMTILGNTEILLSRLESPGWSDHRDLLTSCVRSIARAGERSTDLTKQLLAFSRNSLTQPEPVDTQQLLDETKITLQPLLPETITFDVQVASDVVAIYGNAGQIEQVITNLVLNARDSISDVGCVTVRCENLDVSESLAAVHTRVRPGPYVQITVTDDGSGMSEDVLTHMFEPFFSTKPVGKGTGLGLATVHGIVSQMGGFITVESEQGVGTTFRVTLPAATHANHTVDTTDAQTYPGDGEVILVCEDERSVRDLISKILIDAGYAVLTAEDGVQALRVARASVEPVKVLVTDIVMPGMNGFELYKQISSELADIHVVFVSGYAKEAGDHEVLQSKKHALIHKPFKSDELLKVVWHKIHSRSTKSESPA